MFVKLREALHGDGVQKVGASSFLTEIGDQPLQGCHFDRKSPKPRLVCAILAVTL